jgi:hypothetical protein
MCHDHFTRNRAWEDRIERELPDEDDEETVDGEPIPPLQADDDPDEDLEVLTDGGDE